jgi:cell division protein FtsI (penicillin-binding protein 3)
METESQKRSNVLFLVLLAGLGILTLRIFSIQVLAHTHYQSIQIDQSRSLLNSPEIRMSIFDSNGTLLAYSVPTWSIFAETEKVKERQATAARVSSVLQIPTSKILEKLGSRSKFVWIKRKASKREAEALKDLEGVKSIVEYDRVYCHGETASHLLGFVDIDEKGCEGAERAINNFIDADRYQPNVLVDGLRRVIWQDSYSTPIPGNVYLTVDLDIQKIAEDELRNAVKKHRPSKALCVALDPQTGKILALVALPSFDPNNPEKFPASHRRNPIVTDTFECGSTMKLFTVAAALERSIVRPDTIFFCENGKYTISGRTIHDHHPFANLTVREVIINSSNVGAVKIGALTGKNAIYEYLVLFGFGKKTGVELPAESRGRLIPLDRWTSQTLSSVPIGYEIGVTPIQLCRAFCVFGNGGKLVKPHVLSHVEDRAGNLVYKTPPNSNARVIRDKTWEDLLPMLTGVVETGTGKSAKVDGLVVGGKTGTSQKLDPTTHSYTSGKHTAFFVGLAPLPHAKICIAVIIDEPHGEYYGGQVAAPVVGRILSRIRSKLQ